MTIIRDAKAARKLENKAIATAVSLLSKYDAETVSKIIWNRYGFLSDVVFPNRDALRIHGVGEIEMGETP